MKLSTLVGRLSCAWVVLLVACSGIAEPTQDPITLTVGAAASTAPVMKEIASAYLEIHPEVELNFTFAASGVLLHQIKEGAPLDAFVFADLQTLDQAKQSGIPIGSVHEVARNRLLVVTSSDGASGLSDLAVGKVAIGNPKYVPLGRYSRNALMALGLWEVVQDKAVLAGSAAQVREYVIRGEVDGALVYGSDVRVLGESVKVLQDLTGFAAPVYLAGVLEASAGQTKEAERFVVFLSSETAARLFLKHGFRAIEGAQG